MLHPRTGKRRQDFMVTKAKEPPVEEEVKVETTETDEVVTKSNLRALLEELLPDLLKGEETSSEVVEETTKPVTEREKEARTYDDVRKAVKEFLASDENKVEKSSEKETEKIPGSSVVRKIEKILWGAE
jgi:hypothetical protein